MLELLIYGVVVAIGTAYGAWVIWRRRRVDARSEPQDQTTYSGDPQVEYEPSTANSASTKTQTQIVDSSANPLLDHQTLLSEDHLSKDTVEATEDAAPVDEPVPTPPTPQEEIDTGSTGHFITVDSDRDKNDVQQEAQADSEVVGESNLGEEKLSFPQPENKDSSAVENASLDPGTEDAVTEDEAVENASLDPGTEDAVTEDETDSEDDTFALVQEESTKPPGADLPRCDTAKEGILDETGIIPEIDAQESTEAPGGKQAPPEEVFDVKDSESGDPPPPKAGLPTEKPETEVIPQAATSTAGTGSENRPPAKYQPSVRTAQTTKRSRRKPRNSGRSRTHSYSVHVRVVFRRRKCRISLMPQRAEEMPEEISVEGPEGKETWYACEDTWYGDVLPPRIGQLLENGAAWMPSEDKVDARWVLSKRDIYVLAPNSTLGGRVSCPRLVLFEKDQLVLCTRQREEAVRKSLADCGCGESIVTADGDGIPTGWILFQNVYPTVAVPHDPRAGILNILRPLHDIEIDLSGGIRLSHSTWLCGHPPAIRIRGAGENPPEVQIDGMRAAQNDDSTFSCAGWDTPGVHTVFCGGNTQSYELSDGQQSWDVFNSYTYRASEKKKRSVSICGPLVVSANDKEHVSLAPYTNSCLIGAVAGQITLSPQPNTIQKREYVAVADFRVVWMLPPDPFTCDKSVVTVRLARANHIARIHPKRYRRREILRWCYAILNASRRGLRIEPDTEETKCLWDEYRAEARRMWRQLR